MTVGDWLIARTPAPPAPLAARLRAMLGARLEERATNAHEVLLATAETLLRELLSIECAMRDRALDLLAVDALVTYAFEAAAEQPETLAQRSTAAMASIAGLATQASSA
ncbi:MAG: hypothetical protein M3Y30_14060 [Gemmatimonadota bacterium]|nr:hypothetical protein [Gemmatimonadota bacterium]